MTELSISDYCPHPPSPKQQLFLSMRYKVVGYGGAGGGGKSDAQLMAALQGIEIPSYRAILLRNSFKSLSLPGALLDRSHEWWDRSPAKWRELDKTWTFPSGARITFGYLDKLKDLEQYQSSEFHYIGFDESTQFNPYLITCMFARLRRRKSGFPKAFPLRVRFTTNPGGIAHKWHVKFFNVPKAAEVDRLKGPVVSRDDFGVIQRVFVPAYAQDNPGLDIDNYLESLSFLPEVRRKQIRDGLWVEDITMLVYGKAIRARIEQCLPDGGYKFWYLLSIDFGASRSTAFTIYAVCEELQQMYVVKCYKPENANNAADIAERYYELDSIYHFNRVVADHGALGKGYIDEMRKRFSIPVQNAEKQNKRGYIDLFNDAVEREEVIFLPAAYEGFYEEAGALIWKDENRILEMPGMANHRCDSTLYGFREAKHYTATPKKQDELKPHDPIEDAIMARVRKEQATINRLGTTTLPSLYRQR